MIGFGDTKGFDTYPGASRTKNLLGPVCPVR